MYSPWKVQPPANSSAMTFLPTSRMYTSCGYPSVGRPSASTVPYGTSHRVVLVHRPPRPPRLERTVNEPVYVMCTNEPSGVHVKLSSGSSSTDGGSTLEKRSSPLPLSWRLLPPSLGGRMSPKISTEPRYMSPSAVLRIVIHVPTGPSSQSTRYAGPRERSVAFMTVLPHFKTFEVPTALGASPTQTSKASSALASSM